MKTIDELRGFLSKSPSVIFPDEVSEYVDAIERELEERYIEGPTDKNGDPITYRTMTHQWGALEYIACEMHPDGTYEWFVRGHDTSAPLEKAKHVTVAKPPTVEDEIRSIVQLCFNIKERGERWSVDDVMQSGNVSDVVAKLRLKEER